MAASKDDFSEFFFQADRNKNQHLSNTELGNILRGGGYRGTDYDIALMFNVTDSDRDNAISYREYMYAMGFTKMDPDEMYYKYETVEKVEVEETSSARENMASMSILKHIFHLFDQDGSGEIDKKELKHIFKELGKHMSDAEMERIMELADEDGSGTLNYEEFIEVVMQASQSEKKK